MTSLEIDQKPVEDVKIVRAYVYVDGFNLFYGMKAANYRRYYWLNLESLAKGLTKQANTEIQSVKYFTARITGNPLKHERQSTYLDALSSCPLVSIMEGNYVSEPNDCQHCFSRCPVMKEKQTDTNIATEIVCDAFLDAWDIAYLISGDSDLVPPVRLVKNRFPQKAVIIVNPPSRSSRDLIGVYGNSFWLNEQRLRDNQFPDSVVSKAGKTMTRPKKWA